MDLINFHWILDLILFCFLLLFAIDSLTMLPVRRIYEFVYRVCIRTVPHHVLMIDLDNFKAINDQHGHSAGDMLLRASSKALIKEVPFGCFRYGGEEFVVLLPWIGKEKAIAIAERIRRRIEIDVRVTASIGVGECEEQADKAMYLAKKNGKNQVRVFAGPG